MLTAVKIQIFEQFSPALTKPSSVVRHFMNTITEINKENGNLNFSSNKIENSTILVNSTHQINGNEYESFSQKAKTISDVPVEILYYYKNGNLKSIHIIIEQHYLQKIYKPEDIDYKDYLTPYITFCKNENEKLLFSLIKVRKQKFSWGRIKIITDPRVYLTFIEIKYYNLQQFSPLINEEFDYVFINEDGTAREITEAEKAFLSEKFHPNDGARPYIKSTYEQVNLENRISGFLKRNKLPEK